MIIRLFCLGFSFFFQSPPAEPNLNQALRIAYANRHAVKAARLRLRQAKSAAQALGAYPATRVGLGYTPRPNVGGSDDDAVLIQPVDIFGRTRASRQAGQAQIHQAEASLRQTLLDIQDQTAAAYNEAVAAKLLRDSAQNGLVLATKIQGVTKMRTEEGAIPRVQLIRSEVELGRAQETLQVRQAALTALEQNLSRAVGITITSVPAGFSNNPISDGDLAVLISQRADLQSLSADLESAEAELQIAKVSHAPELELQVRRSPWSEPDPRVNGRVQLTFPLWDHGRSTSEKRAATAKFDAAWSTLADARQQAKAEAQASIIDLNSASLSVRNYGLILANAQVLVEKSQLGFNEGATSLLEVLEAQRSLREVEEGLIEARLRQAQAQVRYLRATGTLLEVPK